MSRDDVSAVKEALADPWRVVRALGLEKGAQRQGGRGVTVCCPAHGDRTPSCSVTRGPDGTVRVRCFGCDLAGDVFTIVAAARGLDVRADFRAVLQEAADVAGVALENGSAGLTYNGSKSERRPPSHPMGAPVAPPSYPADAFDFWTRCAPVTSDAEVMAYLTGRGLDPAAVARLDLARAIPHAQWAEGSLPRWARCAGSSWAESGHRLVVPAYDAQGRLRSVRATRIQTGQGVPNGSPKRLAPAGHTCAGLVFAEPKALALLSNPEGVAEDMHAAWGEVRVLVVEGEPDLWTASIAWPDWPVLGVFSGAWSEDVAARIPDDARVVIATHVDLAGEKYAAAIAASVAGRCRIERAPIGTAEEPS